MNPMNTFGKIKKKKNSLENFRGFIFLTPQK